MLGRLGLQRAILGLAAIGFIFSSGFAMALVEGELFGKAGPPGAAGPPGPQGLIGTQGPAGPRGLRGFQGLQGDTSTLQSDNSSNNDDLRRQLQQQQACLQALTDYANSSSAWYHQDYHVRSSCP